MAQYERAWLRPDAASDAHDSGRVEEEDTRMLEKKEVEGV